MGEIARRRLNPVNLRATYVRAMGGPWWGFEDLKVASLANPSGPIQVPNILGAIPGAPAAATKVMRKWMSDARFSTIPEFIDMTRDLGVTFFACSTTMGVMGVEKSDLIEGADIAGAAAFLDYAAEADVSLFV